MDVKEMWDLPPEEFAAALTAVCKQQNFQPLGHVQVRSDPNWREREGKE